MHVFGAAKLAALAAAALLLSAAPVSAKRGVITKVTLELTGGAGTRAGTSCRLRKHWRYYRAGGRISFGGTVSGSGSIAKVTVVVKRCFGRSFSTVKTLSVLASHEGNFSGSFAVKAVSDCFVEARSRGRVSQRRYFRVR